jgi:hypothetical protein
MSGEQSKEPERLLSFSELLTIPKEQRVKHELRILESLMAQAVRDKDWPNALKVFNEAHSILSRLR